MWVAENPIAIHRSYESRRIAPVNFNSTCCPRARATYADGVGRRDYASAADDGGFVCGGEVSRPIPQSVEATMTAQRRRGRSPRGIKIDLCVLMLASPHAICPREP